MAYIETKHLNYEYRLFEKKLGFKNNLKDFFHRHYQSKRVLTDITFNISQGEKVGLLGPNGAGKSTLIKLLTGILQSDTDNLRVAGVRPNPNDYVFLKRIGVMMGQKSQLNWDLPALDTFKLLKTIYQVDTLSYQARLDKYVQMFHLQAVLNVPVRKLSLGERTKLELIATLLHGPELLILDEPTLGMDIVSQREFHAFLNQINQTNNVTILLISHQMNDIEAVADRLLLLLDGRIQFDGSVAKLMQTVQDPQRPITLKNVPNHAIVAMQAAEISQRDDQTVVRAAEGDSTITFKTMALEQLQVETPSLEDVVYSMFRKQERSNEVH
ncbi:ABC transporter ATP-binding protein [Fructilactobacillus cliffordii]|uniref:ATP-binding cassette domain-containing protein n=1 Tax=Fructilactobacillus cliffordii TaxID=2940299 RepID=A0A9Q8ZUL3_9LACO|nr:ATP-binding cassette domain-containing protein [Fructilactobacillus cliffordii]USS88796.1 ATP-binding cassette domain-containing protein [Fructilactobacillus cliffordii]